MMFYVTLEASVDGKTEILGWVLACQKLLVSCADISTKIVFGLL